ncbi:glycosyltransferase [Leptobacterium flavescens]|uniref:Glycosyltransferase n=1 Tax=Leptobacterium flavescens TaxID=472055 RepID=A0A6P0UL37_9FLAO|nr:glycosyltransferase family 4 protein [Leptobacterium flavescens]NER13985.1 glycosyltransferase [Leptobacterium flavescens]
MKKIIRITTVPVSLKGLLRGQLRYMSSHYEMIGISSGGEVLDEVAQIEGVRVIPVNMTRKITPLQDLISIIRLIKIFRREKPFIVHTHTPKAGTVGMIAAKLANVDHRLHTIAGLPLVEARGFKRFILNLVEKITYSCATMIYPNSYGLKDIILENKFTSEKKLKVLGKGSSNGIDVSHFDPSLYNSVQSKSLREELKIDPEDFVFVFIGRLVKDKGINELIQAFNNIYQENPNSKLLLVGSYERDLDPLLPETEKIIDTHPGVISAGWQKDVRPYLHISDVLVFPSYREGFPNVVMQAGAMGLPSIVSNINGCNEIVQDGINGVIIPVKSIEPMEKEMRKMISDPEMRKELAGNAREVISDRYKQDYVWESILQEYLKLEHP